MDKTNSTDETRRSHGAETVANAEKPPVPSAENAGAAATGKATLFQKGNKARSRARPNATADNPYERVRKRVDRLIRKLERKEYEPSRGNAMVQALKLKLELIDRSEFSDTIDKYRAEIAQLKQAVLTLRQQRLPVVR